jgi:hypothetical protein
MADTASLQSIRAASLMNRPTKQAIADCVSDIFRLAVQARFQVLRKFSNRVNSSWEGFLAASITVAGIAALRVSRRDFCRRIRMSQRGDTKTAPAFAAFDFRRNVSR